MKIHKCLKLLCAGKKAIILAILSSIVIVAIALGIILPPKYKHRGGVVSNGKGCAEIGGQMLHNEGSAVDAAIATLLCEGILIPQSLGIGGGFVATIYTKSTGKIETLIARETAPAAATEDMFVGTSVTGAKAVAVPGELMGYWEMHKKYGRIPWVELFLPAIDLCESGHWVSEFLENSIKKHEFYIRYQESMREIFVKKDNNKLYEKGDVIYRPQLAKTLRIIARNGVKELYDGGELAKNFTEDIQKMGGIITIDDLKNYHVEWSSENHTTAWINGYTLYTTPLPTSGPLLAFMINVMNDLYTDNVKIYWQRVIETFKHAFGFRSNLGDLNDPNVFTNVSKTLNQLKDKYFVSKVRKLIYDDRTSQDPKYYGASFTGGIEGGTANVAVLAANGDAITITSTINTHFGAMLRSKRTGIILNNEMDDFSTPGISNSYGVPPSKTNFIKPGKRPMSSMCPSIILDRAGKVVLLVGAAGGTKITTAVATVILKYLVREKSIRNALGDSRMHHQLVPMRVDIEFEVPADLQKFLKSVGHELNVITEFHDGFSVVTAIGNLGGSAIPHYDKRRMGSKFFLK